MMLNVSACSSEKQFNYNKTEKMHFISWEPEGRCRAANRYEKIVFVTKVGREYENTKVHPKSTNSRGKKLTKDWGIDAILANIYTVYDIYFSVIRSRMLPSFISDVKDKHPAFISSVIRSRMFPSFISDVKDKHPTFILASHGAECYRHSFQTLKTNTRHLFLASYGAECYRHSFQTFFFGPLNFLFGQLILDN